METHMRNQQVLIGAEWQPGAKGSYEIVNPANEDIVGEAPEASVEQARAAAEAARSALSSWSRTSAKERAALLARAGEVIAEQAEALFPTVVAETGCTAVVGRQMQIPVAAQRFAANADYARRSPVIPLPPQTMPATPLAPGGLIGALARRQPMGVVACITPYNFPIVNLAGKLAPALAMGNTLVVRPAPQDPLAVIELVRLLREEVGFPPGVVNLVTGSSPETAEALVESADVDMISFTGSTVVGRRIAEVGGRTMKRLLLELGGKGAGLVLEDADIPNAIRMIGSVWTFHSGQVCTAPTRAIVHRSRFDEVVEGLTRFGAGLAVGEPMDPKTVLGPVISAQQRDRIEGAIEAGREGGGEVVLGGTRPTAPDRGFYVSPCLITGRGDSEFANHEIFGPVIVAIPFDDEEEGIAIANQTEYGLYDYVFTRDTGRAMEISARLCAANVGINTTQRNHETPFGGTKQSGLGRDGGEFGLHAYSELQSVVWPG
jgi:acyl-CoA reductase-like NAD-dependent aldehyde dehydrogenase